MAPFKVSTHTLFIYHCSSYEARNFSQSEARFSRGLAKVGFHLIEENPVFNSHDTDGEKWVEIVKTLYVKFFFWALQSLTVSWLLMVERSNENHGKSFLRKWHVDCGILMFHQILIKLQTVQTQKLKEKLKLKNFNLVSDFMQICWTDYGFS